MERSELTTYQRKLAPGKSKSHKGFASRSVPHGLEYQRGTSVGSLFHESPKITSDNEMSISVVMLAYRIMVFMCNCLNSAISFFMTVEKE
jgi:hypothetical protein